MQVQGQKLTRRGALLGTGGGVRVGGEVVGYPLTRVG
jgi:hypothetical protein